MTRTAVQHKVETLQWRLRRRNVRQLQDLRLRPAFTLSEPCGLSCVCLSILPLASKPSLSIVQAFHSCSCDFNPAKTQMGQRTCDAPKKTTPAVPKGETSV